MSGDAPDPPRDPPASIFVSPVGELVAHGLLAPPARPGLLAGLGRFEILRLIGAGGMGVVLLARDTRGGNVAAIKLMKPEFRSDPSIRRRFLKEAEHMRRLAHPNIVPVLEISAEAEEPYFVMPYIEGGNLSRRIDPRRPSDRAAIVGVALPLARALGFAHGRGIIHRDLKPANVLLDQAGHAWLSDFGLARSVFNDSVIDPGAVHCEGTAPYMSPAVAAGWAEDTRCDIYGFGALLYEMITGRPPYEGPSGADIRRQIIAGPPPPIRVRRPDADAGLVAIAEGAMGRALRHRYADMADMVADLERLSAGGPPRGPAGGLERGSARWLRTAAGLALAAILVAVLFAVRLSPHRTPPSAAILPGPAILPRAKPPPAARAASARFRNPVALAVDRQGHLLVCDKAESAIYRIMPDGTATLLAGRPQQPGGEDGVGSAARFSIPRAVASAGAGRWFVADADDVRSIGPGAAVSTWAGALGQPGSIDGPGPNARLDAPSGLAVDPSGTLWVADRYTVRAIDRNGVVRMVAGNPEHAGHRDGPRGTARFGDQEKALAVDAQGGIYLADTINHMIRKVGPDGNVRAFAGAFESGSADGPDSQARFSRPAGIAVDRDGTVFVADAGNHDIRRIAPDGRVTTLAGCAGEPGSADGLGPDARFRRPMGLALAEDGTLFVADTGNGLIRRIARDGTVATIAVHF